MEQKSVPHVMLFPFPLQGHVNPMLQLAELLCLSGLQHVTLVNTEHHHNRLLCFTDAQTRFASFSEFRFETIPDGLPDDHPRSLAGIRDMGRSIKTVMEPAFRDLLFSDHFSSLNRPPVTCIITDGILTFPAEMANELRIPSIDFRVTNASFSWACFCYQDMVDAGELPFQDDEMDKLITSVPGMESFLRCRDLPSFCRVKELKEHSVFFFILVNKEAARRPSAVILNTFEELEASILSHMEGHFRKIYAMGPLHALLNSRRLSLSSSPSIQSSNNSLWEVDRGCMTWLDSQALKSVVYVSFGSVVMMTHEQMLEFWYGLVNSGKPFLWVIRPDAVINKEDKKIPIELTEGTKERGYIVEWSPQEEVLAHPSVGGFLTHCGWGSSLESLIAGVPMVCWPHIGDQLTNSRFLSEVCKVALDMKDVCDRFIIEKMVNDLMDFKRDELVKSMEKITQLAKESVSEGGSSYKNLEALVQDIKAMTLPI